MHAGHCATLWCGRRWAATRWARGRQRINAWLSNRVTGRRASGEVLLPSAAAQLQELQACGWWRRFASRELRQPKWGQRRVRCSCRNSVWPACLCCVATSAGHGARGCTHRGSPHDAVTRLRWGRVCRLELHQNRASGIDATFCVLGHGHHA